MARPAERTRRPEAPGARSVRNGDPDEREIVRAAVSGDPAARGEIVLRYQKMVYNLALRLTRDPEAAAVVMQETFLKVFASLPRFRAGSKLKTWIYRIAVNEALQRLRRDRGERLVELEDLEADPSRDLRYVARAFEQSPHTMLENRELRDRLESAIAELPPKHRAAFVLVDIEGLPLREAARDMGISLPALKSDVRRARLFLRDRLADYIEERQERHPAVGAPRQRKDGKDDHD